ncbi:hypothetical protein FRUB_05915 [Fimbriiglobus ruber]|uniref:Uncharacterized protein n=1 Tax=Fimbriiglobus ruber TaxID=1908690 RepID=A0A225DCZ3_9BACT|nr:hypothetical protein FRUB_05915 [Fimbriiglobus ruber]
MGHGTRVQTATIICPAVTRAMHRVRGSEIVWLSNPMKDESARPHSPTTRPGLAPNCPRDTSQLPRTRGTIHQLCVDPVRSRRIRPARVPARITEDTRSCPARSPGWTRSSNTPKFGRRFSIT